MTKADPTLKQKIQQVKKEIGKGVQVMDANMYQIDNGKYPRIYRFPFILKDPTPGGSNLGRIEWYVEFEPGKKENNRRYVKWLYVWATQTRDERYSKQLFVIPCYTEGIMGHHSYDIYKARDFFETVWRFQFCELHKNPIMGAYPPDDTNVFEIDVSSSIGASLMFKNSRDITK